MTRCSTFRCCRLYSCSRFTWMSKSDAGSTAMPVRSLMKAASARLLSALTVAPVALEAGVAGQRLDRAQLASRSETIGRRCAW